MRISVGLIAAAAETREDKLIALAIATLQVFIGVIVARELFHPS